MGAGHAEAIHRQIPVIKAGKNVALVRRFGLQA
jgi:hypothetical protein